MTLSKRAFLSLFIVILVEGYVVLSSELLAIRVTVPFIGTGTDVVSIIIAAVLLPLSFGYYFGGQFKAHTNRFGHLVTIRRKLTFNILVACGILVFGLSYAPLTHFMEAMIGHDLVNRLVLATLYSALFLVVPVFLLGQTIPLVSNYFRREKLSQITGKILFFSTIGSFIGATFSTLVLMATVGVHYTAALNFILLAGLFFILGKRSRLFSKILMIVFVITGVLFNCDPLLKSMHVVEYNQYNLIRIFSSPTNDIKIMSINHNMDSRYSPTTHEKYEYIDFIEMQYIYSRAVDEKPLNVLVLGAGGFTIGLDDTINTYHYVDIDKSLKDIAEKQFLGRELGVNQIFHPVPAESFLIEGEEKFDLIIVDAYQGDLTLPENMVTQDFFQRVRNRLADNGVVVCNFILNPAFGNAFSQNLDQTFRSVFPLVTRQVIGTYNGWDREAMHNIMYTYHHSPDEKILKTYTDNKNTVYYDKPQTISVKQ